jgi:hypothetical protein
VPLEASRGRVRGAETSTTRTIESLAGLWIARFDLVLPWCVPGRASTRAVRGSILFRDATTNRGMPKSGRLGHPGELEIDFHPFGFRAPSHETTAWRIGKSGFRILLSPAIDRGLIHLLGEGAGDTIGGRWTRIGDTPHAVGTFVLTRAERSGSAFLYS